MIASVVNPITIRSRPQQAPLDHDHNNLLLK